MEATAAELERQMEAAAEASKIAERGMKKATEEAKVKSAAAKAANSVFSSGILTAANDTSTAASMVVRYPTSTSSVVGVSRRSRYT